jgi:hypothetical protein
MATHDFSDTNKVYEEVTETEMTPETELLFALAKGKHFVFLTADVVDVPEGKGLSIGMDHSFPPDQNHVIRYILEATLATLPE